MIVPLSRKDIAVTAVASTLAVVTLATAVTLGTSQYLYRTPNLIGARRVINEFEKLKQGGNLDQNSDSQVVEKYFNDMRNKVLVAQESINGQVVYTCYARNDPKLSNILEDKRCVVATNLKAVELYLKKVKAAAETAKEAAEAAIATAKTAIATAKTAIAAAQKAIAAAKTATDCNAINAAELAAETAKEAAECAARYAEEAQNTAAQAAAAAKTATGYNAVNAELAAEITKEAARYAEEAQNAVAQAVAYAADAADAAAETTLKDAKTKAEAAQTAAQAVAEATLKDAKTKAAQAAYAPSAPPEPSAPPVANSQHHHQQQNKQNPLVPAVANNNAVKRTLGSDVGLATIAQRLKTYVQSRGVLNGVINDIERMFESTGQNVYSQQILEKSRNLKCVLEKNSTMSDNELKPLIKEPIRELQDALKKATQGGYNLKKK